MSKPQAPVIHDREPRVAGLARPRAAPSHTSSQRPMVTSSTGPGSAFEACSLENPGEIPENTQNRRPEEAFSGQNFVNPSKHRHSETLDCTKHRFVSEFLRDARDWYATIHHSPPIIPACAVKPVTYSPNRPCSPARPGKRRSGIGASQASCRLGHAANGSISVERVYVLTMQSRSGFSVTAPIGVQFRVAPDQRRGFRSRAWRYTS